MDENQQFGLGAFPSPPDARDHRVPLDKAIKIPLRWIIGPNTHISMAPVTNQHGLPECGGYTGIDIGRYAGKVTGMGVLDLDAHWLYNHSRQTAGIAATAPAGTNARAVLETMRTLGVPTVGHHDEAEHMIGSYGSLSFDEDSITRALVQYRSPVVIGLAWPNSFFKPVRGVMPAPSADQAGGHMLEIIGKDDNVAGGSALVQNHWGVAWGQRGRAWMPWRFLLDLIHDAWKALPPGMSIPP